MLDSIHPARDERPPALPKPKRNRFRFWFAMVMLLLLFAGIFVGTKLVSFAERISDGQGMKAVFKHFFLAPDKLLEGEAEEEIRMLLLGIAGGSHDGPTLTDTMILATLKPGKKSAPGQISLVSIPRDLVVNIPGQDFRKINSAYAYGAAGGAAGGPHLAIRTVEEMMGISIPYYAVIDFQGFKEIIDDLGGLDIEVEHGFTDSFFPDEKAGYIPPLTFEQGLWHMDGTRALQFARSRHGDNSQGTDFARSRRQQQVLRAVKDKAVSLKVLANLALVSRLLDEFADHVRTNLAPHELKRVYDLTRDIGGENIRSLAIDYERGLVCDQIEAETGAYLLVPCAGLGNYTAIREVLDNQFLINDLAKESPAIEIQNAAGIELLAQRTQKFLDLPSLAVTIGNFRGQAKFDQTTIYDNTGGQKKETLAYLQEKLGAVVSASPFPFPTSGNPDFVIILAPDIETKLP